MSRKAIAIAVICAGLIAFVGCGRNHPVLNVENASVATYSKTANLDRIGKAIILAGTRLGWQMEKKQPGHMVATLFNRGHMAKVDIKYNAETYSITYKDSSNLLYDGQSIHRNYNRWVENLHRHIRSELSRL